LSKTLPTSSKASSPCSLSCTSKASRASFTYANLVCGEGVTRRDTAASRTFPRRGSKHMLVLPAQHGSMSLHDRLGVSFVVSLVVIVDAVVFVVVDYPKTRGTTPVFAHGPIVLHSLRITNTCALTSKNKCSRHQTPPSYHNLHMRCNLHGEFPGQLPHQSSRKKTKTRMYANVAPHLKKRVRMNICHKKSTFC
ncbi:unnamed protein product, partial [Ectocarpus sp. 8 AP-2014]